MAPSLSLLKLFAILLFTSFFFFPLFVQNAIATPITISNHFLASPETFYKQDEATIFDNSQDNLLASPKTFYKGDEATIYDNSLDNLLASPETFYRRDKATTSDNPLKRDGVSKGLVVVFFSNSHDKKAPLYFAESVGGVCLIDTVSNGYIRRNRNIEDPGGKIYTQFLQRMSLALARKSAGTVYIVTQKAGPMPGRMWERIEEPALRANPAVKKVVRVNSEDFNDRTVEWESP
ncbi:hypothetical protein EG327_002390 [Venturia inaequalis]|uniref:Uncharacterized protein n=1 Tax=Venturia inaequalis TaxID=5025 RepID=A0A8H3VID4_VENIN|nr:hypothetical protein EG327_002390 [Venturia inaequalis]